jgi:mono/diheme cytochrome c family protein
MKITRLSAITLTFVLGISACKIYYKPQPVSFTVEADNSLVMHGKHLSQLMCAPCHYDPSTKKYTGIHMSDVPKMIGKIYGSNITQHSENGIGKYTDSELAYLMRTGIARNGKLMPYMQRPNLSDKDLKAIIAFLRSDDELVKPSDVKQARTKYTPMGKIGLSKFSGPLPYPSKEIAEPDKADKINYGKYLIDNLSCYDCHSASFTKIDRMQPERSKGYMGGGNKLKDQTGKTIRSSNLTPHETGIGTWDEKDFYKAMREGISKDNSIITFPMPSYPDLSEEELSAIYAYLKSVPAINHKVKK